MSLFLVMILEQATFVLVVSILPNQSVLMPFSLGDPGSRWVLDPVPGFKRMLCVAPFQEEESKICDCTEAVATAGEGWHSHSP